MAASVRNLIGRSPQRTSRRVSERIPACGTCSSGAPGEHRCHICSGNACEACAPSTVWLPNWRCSHRVCRACVSVLEWGPPLHNRLKEMGESLHALGTASPTPLKIRHSDFEDVLDFCEGALPPLQALRANFNLLEETMHDLSQRLSSILGPPRVEALGPAEAAYACLEDVEQMQVKFTESRALEDYLRSELSQAECDLGLERENHAKLRQQQQQQQQQQQGNHHRWLKRSGSHAPDSHSMMVDTACSSPMSSPSPRHGSQSHNMPCDDSMTTRCHGETQSSFMRRCSNYTVDSRGASTTPPVTPRRASDDSPTKRRGSAESCGLSDNTPRGRGGETCTLCATVLPKRILGNHISCAICSKTVCKKCAPNYVEIEGNKHTQKTCRACIAIAILSPHLTARMLVMVHDLNELANVEQPTAATRLDEAIHLCERAVVSLVAKRATLSEMTFGAGGTMQLSAQHSPPLATIGHDLEVTFSG
eukprot:NODE_5319_length_1783_cov_9.816425.p1 GENE.NODE_5319_length_1783_cov_9.816425~~NODE_5319_length_1783_cov_9.816425.p1  ORF type:complete len:478 (-),score=79.30 NODE_5319_length_1783_cov_9.816425:270-1703(-)